ncbi:MAG: diaminopimelate decarboxylase [Candidatus Helarchaeota archaeon]
MNEFLRKKNLEVKNNHLIIGGCDTVELAEKYGTPLYVINKDTIVERYRSLKHALLQNYDNVKIHYAVKANTNLAILNILNKEGAHLDCVSTGEIYLALKVGFDPKKILYTGNNYSDDEFRFALKNNVMINLDAFSQIKRLVNILDDSNMEKPIISFRVNPEFGGGHHDHCITAGPDIKFGILDSEIIKVYRKAQEYGFNKFGIHMHIGSGILDVNIFKVAAEKYLDIITKIKENIEIDFEFVDFGGGLGIPYRPSEQPLDLKEYSTVILGLFKEKMDELNLQDVTFCIEPGRYIVAESSIILSEVNTIKESRTRNWVGIDAGFNVLIRPTMYGSYHHILVANKMGDTKGQKSYDIAGPICESGDVLAKDRKLPIIEENDLIAILDAGAYGFSMSSIYNSRLLPAEVMVSNGKSQIVRERWVYEDLLHHQKNYAEDF